jgi:hypothetical protein
MPAGRPKGSSGTNKSSIIREYIKANPTATTNEVMEALGQRGIEVSQALVAGVRSREMRGPGNKSRKRGEITVSELNSINAMVEKFDDRSVIMNIIDDMTTLIKEIGGIDRFEEAMKEFQNWKPESESLKTEASETSDDDDDDDSDDDEDEDEDEDE